MLALKTASYRFRAAVGTGVGRCFSTLGEDAVELMLVMVFVRLKPRCDWLLAEEILNVLCTDDRSEAREGGGGGGLRTA